MKTLRTPQPTSSDHKKTPQAPHKGGMLELRAPAKWSELTQEQLRYVLKMLTQRSSTEVKVLMLLRFCGIRVLEKNVEGLFKCRMDDRCIYLKGWQVQQLMHTFDYVDGYEGYTVRLDAQCGGHAANILLHGVPFTVYLQLEKYYQGFLRNRNNTSLLERMAQYLYGDEKHEKTFSEEERLHCFLWFSWVKKEFGRYFPHFFRPSSGRDKGTELAIIDQMNVQIRALTGGDVTKEKEVMELDCWRALTELNAKAYESEQLKKNKK